MPSNVHNRIATSRMGYPEVKEEAGPRKFYLGLIAHLARQIGDSDGFDIDHAVVSVGDCVLHDVTPS